MAVRSIPSPLPAYPAGSSRLSVRRIPSWGRRHRWAGLDDPGPARTVNDGIVVAVGDGVARGFSWVHGLGVVPASAHVDHPTSLALPAFDLGWDATRISVRFVSAPTRSIDLRWAVVAPDTGTTAVVVPLAPESILAESGTVLTAESGEVLVTEGAL